MRALFVIAALVLSGCAGPGEPQPEPEPEPVRTKVPYGFTMAGGSEFEVGVISFCLNCGSIPAFTPPINTRVVGFDLVLQLDASTEPDTTFDFEVSCSASGRGCDGGPTLASDSGPAPLQLTAAHLELDHNITILVDVTWNRLTPPLGGPIDQDRYTVSGYIEVEDI